ncbi:hypothetical protein LKMONMHP_3745 [Methylobacterium organophilum]|uniref:Transposase n=1 Tax=Methylobacterium organophilum TaxID=410 RepID=A0ABQ4TCS9_METOR|nr:hypothetical protein LKMONMHP_3745 [Methylobacterium organophilum]
MQVNEIWSFTHCKHKNVATAKAALDCAGGVGIWTAIDTDTKLILAYLVGEWDAEYTNAFMLDVAERPSAAHFGQAQAIP